MNQEHKGSSKVLIIILIVLALIIIGLVTYILVKNKSAQPSAVVNTPTAQQPAAAQADQTIKIEAYDPVMGSATAPLTVVEVADFQCPYCGAASGQNQTIVKMMQQNDATWQPVIPNLIKDYVDTGKVRLVFKQFPFLGSESDSAAAASLCASDQGKFLGLL